MPRFLLLLIVAALATACAESGDSQPTTRIRLATTTSTDNSGLLRDLLPRFTRASDIEVDVIAVGTGKALRLGAAGDADVVLVHARSREDAFVAAGHADRRHDVMWNDFVIAGPPADPAKIRGEQDVLAALRRLHRARAAFVSRGDDSGTHIREHALWSDAGVEPRDNAPSYFEAGAGMGGCLTRADELGAYLLCDRGTFLAYKRQLALEILVEGDPRLRNPYGALVVRSSDPSSPRAAAAQRFVDWLTGPEGQRAIGAFRLDGAPLFHPHQAVDREGE